MIEKRLEISEARRLINNMESVIGNDTYIVVTRHQRPAFAIIGLAALNSMRETIEIMSSPDAIDSLKRGLADVEAGRIHNHADVIAKLDAEIGDLK